MLDSEQAKKRHKSMIHSPSCSPEVTIIVITYDQDWDKLARTLDSIVIQEGVTFEIIVCDDGSETRSYDVLKEYFSSKRFSDYLLICHDQNIGTVSNYYSGLCKAKGKYSKLLSPGDYLADNKTLYKWIRFLEKTQAEWSFSDACYYRSDNKSERFFRARAMPQIIRPYIMYDENRCIWNYTALTDVANGAAMIGSTQTQALFCRLLKENGIKYCEDYIYRLMMFHGIIGCYFPEAAVCYEYGAGISTSNNTFWHEKQLEDYEKLIQILCHEQNPSHMQKMITTALIRGDRPCKLCKVFIKGKLVFWLKRHFFPRLTPLPVEINERVKQFRCRQLKPF